MDSTKIEPNDIAIILRPDFEKGKEFKGNFEILIAGYGPFTMNEDQVRSMVSIAMMIASTVSLMEEDPSFTERVMQRCSEIYTDPDVIMAPDVDDEFVLSATTKCVGGMQ